MPIPWDYIIDSISTRQKTADAARVLLDSGQPDLACMILREKLIWDPKFGFSDHFIAIANMPSIFEYLSPKPPQTIVSRLTTHL